MKLLTIGGSRGLGLAIASLLENEAECSTIFSRTRPPKSLISKWIQGDLVQSSDVEKIDGTFDLIVLSSGLYDENFGAMTEARLKSMVDLHVLGTLQISQRLPRLLNTDGTLVLLASSSAHPRSPSPHVAYVSTKWAVRGAGFAASRLYPQFRMLILSPEWIDTDPFIPDGDWVLPPKPLDQDPLGRLSCWDVVDCIQSFLGGSERFSDLYLERPPAKK